MNTIIPSRARAVTSMQMPQYLKDAVLYQFPLELNASARLPAAYAHYTDTVNALIEHIPRNAKTAYLTIDERSLVQGQTHRRAGAHIDGNWDPALNSHRRHKMPSTHTTPGALLLLSNQVGCRAYVGDFIGEPGDGGDCEHLREQLDASPSFLMMPNVAYITNVFGVHESIPVADHMQRCLIRINCPDATVEF